jgi:uncharacterized membrane protein
VDEVILNLNKDFFFGAFIWYMLLNGILMMFLSLIGEKRKDTYSFADGFILAIICIGWVLA